MAQLDPVNVRLRPLGAFVMTREVEERHRVAVMGDLPFFIGNTPGTDKRGEEADDVGCNKTRIEEVVAVGPGKFGGFRQKLVRRKTAVSAFPAKLDVVTEVALVDEPWWETPDCKPGDLVAFTDMARPTTITLAGRAYTFFEFDHSICAVLDRHPETARAASFDPAAPDRIHRIAETATPLLSAPPTPCPDPSHDSPCTPEQCYFETEEGRRATERSRIGLGMPMEPRG